MIAVMVPVSAFAGAWYTAYLFMAAFVGVLVLASLNVSRPVMRRLVIGGAVACGGSLFFAQIILLCSSFVWCW